MARFHEKAQVWVVHTDQGGAVHILLLLTQIRGEYGSFWQPVTGSVESSETARDGALRELREETGLQDSGKLEALGYEFTFQGRGGRACHELVYWWNQRSDNRPQIQIDAKEHSRYEWVTPEEARGRLKFESNRRALEILLNRLNENGETS